MSTERLITVTIPGIRATILPGTQGPQGPAGPAGPAGQNAPRLWWHRLLQIAGAPNPWLFDGNFWFLQRNAFAFGATTGIVALNTGTDSATLVADSITVASGFDSGTDIFPHLQPIRLITGSTATGHVRIVIGSQTANVAIPVRVSAQLLPFLVLDFLLPTLSTPTDRFAIGFGLGFEDAITDPSTVSSPGFVGIFYSDDVNSGRFLVRHRAVEAAGLVSTQDTGIAVTANVVYQLCVAFLSATECRVFVRSRETTPVSYGITITQGSGWERHHRGGIGGIRKLVGMSAREVQVRNVVWGFRWSET